MSLWIDPVRFLPIRLRYQEPGGDVTDYRFEDLTINGPIPDGRFVLDLPDDVQLVSSGR
jgi:outer membrane lipoprotein-sorting protein